MTRGNKIRKLREDNNMTQTELAERIRVSKQSLYKYENGIVTNIPSDKIEAIADVFDVSPAYIMGWEDEQSQCDNDYPEQLTPISNIGIKRYPLLGAVACGEPIYREEDGYIECMDDIDADFCLVCKGDSMINARIYDGDVVFIKHTPVVENGQIAAVSVDNEVTLKRVYYYPDKNKLVLNPENPAYEPLIYTKEELNEVRILGRAVKFLSNVR